MVKKKPNLVNVVCERPLIVNYHFMSINLSQPCLLSVTVLCLTTFISSADSFRTLTNFCLRVAIKSSEARLENCYRKAILPTKCKLQTKKHSFVSFKN